MYISLKSTYCSEVSVLVHLHVLYFGRIIHSHCKEKKEPLSVSLPTSSCYLDLKKNGCSRVTIDLLNTLTSREEKLGDTGRGVVTLRVLKSGDIEKICCGTG